MINRWYSIVFPALSLACLSLLQPATAHADLKACGGIFLSSDAACEYRPKQECMTQCMTVAVEHSCVAKVYDTCQTSCTQTASVECENSCTSTCVNSCTTTATTSTAPSCSELCLADCGPDDDKGACGRAAHQSACGRCNKHNCDKKCEAKCGDRAAEKKVTTVTECMPTCTNACSASCTAKMNTQCQVDCQEQTYTQCEQSMVEQCKTECMQDGGAIFCDGQFVNASNSQTCADELLAKIEIDIDIDGAIKTVGDTTTGAAECVGDEVDKACSVANPGAGSSAPLALIPLAVVGLWRITRRRGQR